LDSRSLFAALEVQGLRFEHRRCIRHILQPFLNLGTIEAELGFTGSIECVRVSAAGRPAADTTRKDRGRRVVAMP
jgi:hypothetical protein